MPILTQDIKLLKSAVMADTSDGGGAMTGVEVIDGQSNNLYPDTSALDRALGRVNLRKVYGVAHTNDTDTLLGAHAIITDAPDDPLVHCCLLKTPGWADTRDTAREAIEKYLVKGPLVAPQLYDAHYSGSLQIRLISFIAAPFPQAGEALVLRTPAGIEQFVRLLKVVTNTQQVAVIESGAVQVFTATIATCDLGQALDYDFIGPAAARVVPTGFAQVFATNDAVGAKFYGIKKLALAAAPGDLSVQTEGGIFTPVVPAATIETPLLDQYPLVPRGAVAAQSYAPITLPVVSAPVGPGTVLTAPTPITPRTLAMTVGATTFSDNGAGDLLQGTTVVGAVNYALKTITLAASAPNYGISNVTVTYAPGTLAGMGTRTSSFAVTQANQGLVFTNVFEPVPAPGTFAVEYMAQGRWYTLLDAGNGRLAGADSSYGTGNVVYSTGSVSMTLGAIPDADSQMIASYGNPQAAQAPLLASLPTKLSAFIELPFAVDYADLIVAWTIGGVNHTATMNASGQLVGNATGAVGISPYQTFGGVLSSFSFMPTSVPIGPVVVTANRWAGVVNSANVVDNGGRSFSLSAAGTGGQQVTPGSFRATLLLSDPASPTTQAAQILVYDRNGFVCAQSFNNDQPIDQPVGTINYATGAVLLNASVTVGTKLTTNPVARPWGISGAPTITNYLTTSSPNVLAFFGLNQVSYSIKPSTAPAPVVTSFATLTWTAALPTGVTLPDSAVFTLGGELYTCANSTLRRGWNVATGVASSPAAGSITAGGVLAVAPGGLLTVTGLSAEGSNLITWANYLQNAADNRVSGGVFRTAAAPLKTGVFQIQSGNVVGIANDPGVISGGITGKIDVQRGICTFASSTPLSPETISYNAVMLQYLPLDGALLGLSTERLPLDGKVPIFRKSELVVVHNTQTFTLPNPLVKNTGYNLGRVRLASVRVKDLLGVTVPDTLYNMQLDPGVLTVPMAADITAYAQPFKVEHRIEDLVLCRQADISGKLDFTRSLTHTYPAGSSYVSSALPFGDLFGRAFNTLEQQTWTGAWADARIGAGIIANFNEAQYPIGMTNRGAITERWAMIFTNTTAFRIVGENVGDIGSGTTGAACAPNNPSTGTPYFRLPEAGWGAGWAAGNVLRFNTAACGAPFWAVRTVLQGPAGLDSDAFTLAFRGDVDRP